ncbi:MAG: hypothetical protein AAFX87_20685 [Bacteroidota bacterium]
MKHILFTLIIGCTTFNTLFSQTQDQKNAIYGNIGAIPATYSMVTVNVERHIVHVGNKFNGGLSVRLGYGSWGDWGGSGEAFVTGLNFLSGKRKSHIEFGLGPILFTEEEFRSIEVIDPNGNVDFLSEEFIDKEWRMGINLGYRYTSRFFMLRGGFSNLETIYLGMGITF